MDGSINTARIQYIAIAGSIIIIAFIFELIRKNKVKERYALLWLFWGIVFLLFSLFRNGLEILSRMIGIAYAPATLFLILILGFFFIMLHYSVILSELNEKNKVLIQEIGLLKFEMKQIKKHTLTDAKPNTDITV